MAANMDALLRIATRVTGAEQVTALQGKFKQVEGAAQTLTSRIGPLGGALGALAPVATVGGLAALVGRTIEAGDKFNDLSQRTGVSVESLAKFNKAAATSGTDIDAVAKSLSRLSKGLYETATTSKGATADALNALGISAKDAAGNLKSADQVTLEIANKFKAMPDGVEKTALAMQLFGKAGAEMIPMLNEGGAAIESLSVKMTTAFAQKADEYNDKLATLGGKVGGLAAGITVALLPALDAVATVLTLVVDGFAKLPGPIQAIVGGLALLAVSFTVLAPIAASVITVLGAFQGLAIGATIAGWLGALGPLAAGLAAFATAIVGWPLLIGAALGAVGILIYQFRDDIGKVVGAIGKTIYDAVDTVNKTIRTGIGAVWDWVSKSIGSVAGALAQPFESAAGAIKGVLRSVLQFGAQVINGFLGAVNQMINAVNSVASRLKLPTLPTFGAVSVPSFEGGGYTGNAPRSGGLDGQGGFMAMLHPRETVIDHARTGAGGGVPNINITTGDVLQMPDGSQWVSMTDLEQAMRATAAGVLGQLRTPAGRVAMGGA
jgi:phage-related protein